MIFKIYDRTIIRENEKAQGGFAAIGRLEDGAKILVGEVSTMVRLEL